MSSETSANPRPPGVPVPRVLIVEDDLDQQELIREVLADYYGRPGGEHLVAVATARACLELDLTQFDIVLLDYNLPDMPGLEALGRILSAADLPVIVVTGENVSTTAAEAIRRGAQDYVVKLGDYLFALPLVVEKNLRLHRMQQENSRLMEEIRVKNAQLQDSLEKLQVMATTDHLTGLANRRAFSTALERAYSEAVRYDFDLACAMCDLDHYKTLNDALGHQVGDRVLVAAAEVICSSLRGSDTAARYGGDEFVLLLPHTSLEIALGVLHRIAQQLTEASARYTHTAGGVTMSAGIATLKSDRPASADALVAMADRALYIAKDRGKDRIVTFGEIGAAAPEHG